MRRAAFHVLVAVAMACTGFGSLAQALDIDLLWDFDDPAASERAFRNALDVATGDVRLELLTQIARTYGLRRRFAEAHALLDAIEPLTKSKSAGPAPRVRFLLERGRTFRSSGRPEMARPLFLDAWELARMSPPGRPKGETPRARRESSPVSQAGGPERESPSGQRDVRPMSSLDGLAVDAAHMVALVEQASEDQLRWNQRALQLAKSSTDPAAQAWQASLHNNIGWTLHDSGRYDDALRHFEAALHEREKRGQASRLRAAKWAVARCLRSLGRFDEALRIQRALEADLAAANATDGYVDDELAELLDATGKDAQARPYFRRAAEALAKDSWFAQNEAARLARLRAKGE